MTTESLEAHSIEEVPLEAWARAAILKTLEGQSIGLHCIPLTDYEGYFEARFEIRNDLNGSDNNPAITAACIANLRKEREDPRRPDCITYQTPLIDLTEKKARDKALVEKTIANTIAQAHQLFNIYYAPTIEGSTPPQSVDVPPTLTSELLNRFGASLRLGHLREVPLEKNHSFFPTILYGFALQGHNYEIYKTSQLGARLQINPETTIEYRHDIGENPRLASIALIKAEQEWATLVKMPFIDGIVDVDNGYVELVHVGPVESRPRLDELWVKPVEGPNRKECLAEVAHYLALVTVQREAFLERGKNLFLTRRKLTELLIELKDLRITTAPEAYEGLPSYLR